MKIKYVYFPQKRKRHEEMLKKKKKKREEISPGTIFN